MKITKIDKLGRIVIPASFRKRLNILENDGIKIECFAEEIVIKPAKSICLICSKGEVKNNTIQVCDNCINIIKNM